MSSKSQTGDLKLDGDGQEQEAPWLWGVKGVVKVKVRIECHALSVNHRTEEY